MSTYHKSYHMLVVIPYKTGLYLCTTVKLEADTRFYAVKYLYTVVGDTYNDVVQFCLNRDALQVTPTALREITTRAPYRQFIFQNNHWNYLNDDGTDNFVSNEAVFYLAKTDVEDYLETLGYDKLQDNFTIKEGDILLNYNYNLFRVVKVNSVKDLTPLTIDDPNSILHDIYGNDPGSYIVTGDIIIDSAGEFTLNNSNYAEEYENKRFYISKDTLTANADMVTTKNKSNQQFGVEVYRRGG